MYKITIKKNVNGVTKEVTIETDDVQIVQTILQNEEIISVDADIPNRNIYDDWLNMEKEWKKRQIPGIWKTGDNPLNAPFTVTC